MNYVALLRGINVGGKARVEMPRLKKVFEDLGFTSVATYINSGNVVFHEAKRQHGDLATIIEAAIEKEFGFAVKVVVRSQKDIEAIAKAMPSSWQNDADMKCDVMFLWEEYDKPDVIQGLTIKPELEDVKYVAGAILWRVDRQNVTRSGIMKLVGTPLYKHMTIRNCNTFRKIDSMLNEIVAE